MRERYNKLSSEAYYLPDGTSKVALLGEAVRIAEAHLTEEDVYDARMHLTEAAVMSGKIEKAIVSFAWCLSYFDKQKHGYAGDILWHYKWICNYLGDFPEIKLDKIEETLEDYRRRLQENGYGLRSYYKLRRNFAAHCGLDEEANRYHLLWEDTSDDDMTDCHACEVNSKAFFLLQKESFEQAYEVAEPIFTGQLSCHSVPHSTFSKFLLPLLEQERFHEAAEFFRKAQEILDYTYLQDATDLLEYLIVVDLAKAVAWFEEYVKEALSSFVPSQKYYFYRAAVLLFEQLNARQRGSIQLPQGSTPTMIEADLMDIAERFDQRNQNDRFVNGIEEKRAKLQELRRLYEK